MLYKNAFFLSCLGQEILHDIKQINHCSDPLICTFMKLLSEIDNRFYLMFETQVLAFGHKKFLINKHRVRNNGGEPSKRGFLKLFRKKKRFVCTVLSYPGK